jgi:mRNA-degrading endonuclease RelE of RelBE toxin-antitoxin system
MNYKIEVGTVFKKQAKRLIQKFPSLKSELETLISSLETDPTQGESLGNQCFKIRLAISSKGKGKSGGARIITQVRVTKFVVVLLSIYDKSEQADISDRQIKLLLSQLPD